MGVLLKHKFRLYSINGTALNKDKVLSGISLIEKEDRHRGNIYFYHPKNYEFAEIHYTTKSGQEADDFFSTDEFDIWTLTSNDADGLDSILLYTQKKDSWNTFQDTALYSFDKIVIYCEDEKGISEVFGHHFIHGKKLNKTNNYFTINLKGFYSAINFCNWSNNREVLINPITDESYFQINDNHWCFGDFGDIFFKNYRSSFMNDFYRTINKNVENQFSSVYQIDFFFKGILTSRIKWVLDKDDDFWEWKHFPNDGFYNCANKEYFAYHHSPENKRKW